MSIDVEALAKAMSYEHQLMPGAAATITWEALDERFRANWRKAAGIVAAEYARLVPAEDDGRLLDSVMARVQLRLLAGETDATYSPTEVAELVAAVIDEQRETP